jgi:cyanate lyase
MQRADLTEKILDVKRSKKLSWKAIAKEIGGNSPVLITAALLGQMRLDPPQAHKAALLFGLSPDEATMLTETPYRGSLPPGPPTDPLIYRFYELVQVYGTSWKALIEEEFGEGGRPADGIMSAIDFDMTIEKQPDPKGDRVKIAMTGKFLHYKRY